MKTADQRVSQGIDWLDMSDATPINWRNKIDIDALRFADPDKGPLGQLFGGYIPGLKQLKIVGGGDFLGFRSSYNKVGDTKELKEAWANALRTDKCWGRLGNDLTRIIRGVRYLIYKDREEVKIMKFVAGQAIPFSRSYCSYDSAKRSIRKATEKNGV